MKSPIYLLFFLLLISPAVLLAQEKEKQELPPGWTRGAGIGLDMAQLLQINPKVGAGQNRLGFGSAINYFAKYRQDRMSWDNLAGWQFAIQRLGSGLIGQRTAETVPFQKAIDELRLSSKLGYRTSKTSKYYYTAAVSFLSQLTKTYEGPNAYPGYYLSDITSIDSTYTGDPLLSQLFSPATITISFGMDYKPNESLSIFYSPLGGKLIIVANDDIAARGVHGNTVRGEKVNGRFADFDHIDAQLGSLVRANLTQANAAETLAFTSSLTLFSNYLRDPQNIDIDWTNEFTVKILKNIQLAITLNAFYDHDVKVQITDLSFPAGVRQDIAGNPITGRRVSLTQQLLVKYARTF